MSPLFLRRMALLLAPFLVGIAVGWWTPGTATTLPFLATATITTTPTATITLTPSATPTPVATETPVPTATMTSTATAAATSTPTPSPTIVPRSSVLDEGTLLAMYGRALNVAPILGLLGAYKDFDEMDRDIAKRFAGPIKANNGGKPIIPTVHLIYALAIPCTPNDDCLLYLEGAKIDVVKEYIEPASKRGWEVILDSQLGRSDPVTQVKRMIDKGYLKYENVHVALDPEFHAYPNRQIPGIPVGVVEADQINKAQELLDEYVRKEGLKRRKILMLHQFGDPEVDDGVPFMVQNKKSLKTFPTIDIVFDADGFGGPDSKASKYNRMLNPVPYPFIRYRALKLFTPNKEAPNHYDKPQMEWSAVFGRTETPGGVKIRWAPNVIVIA